MFVDERQRVSHRRGAIARGVAKRGLVAFLAFAMAFGTTPAQLWAEGADGDGPAGLGLVGKHIGRGWVRGFTITGGAIASTIGHDSHNVCVVGDNAADMMAAVEAVGQGGHVLVRNGEVVARIPLALGGLMSEGTAEDVAAQHDDFMVKARAMGIEPPLDPIMGIIFLPLPVIPTLRIRPEGMFDVTTFTYAD